MDGSRPPHTSAPSHSFFLHQSHLPFCQKKRVSLAELKPLLLPKLGTLPLPVPGVSAFKSFIPPRCCVVPALWLIPGTPCLGGNAGILLFSPPRGKEKSPSGLASAVAGAGMGHSQLCSGRRVTRSRFHLPAPYNLRHSHINSAQMQKLI